MLKVEREKKKVMLNAESTFSMLKIKSKLKIYLPKQKRRINENTIFAIQ